MVGLRRYRGGKSRSLRGSSALSPCVIAEANQASRRDYPYFNALWRVGIDDSADPDIGARNRNAVNTWSNRQWVLAANGPDQFPWSGAQ